jgi:hypothetical protein
MEDTYMNLKLKAPKIAKNATSNIVSKKASEKLGGDCHIRFTEAEIGMRDGKVYAKFAIDGEMNRADLVNLIKMITSEEA